jgi:hypothetical protein
MVINSLIFETNILNLRNIICLNDNKDYHTIAMYFEDDIPLPPLVPIKSKKKKVLNTEKPIYPNE